MSADLTLSVFSQTKSVKEENHVSQHMLTSCSALNVCRSTRPSVFNTCVTQCHQETTSPKHKPTSAAAAGGSHHDDPLFLILGCHSAVCDVLKQCWCTTNITTDAPLASQLVRSAACAVLKQCWC
eukprot:1157413-Pelagomonas_calceolata.AAC.1